MTYHNPHLPKTLNSDYFSIGDLRNVKDFHSMHSNGDAGFDFRIHGHGCLLLGSSILECNSHPVLPSFNRGLAKISLVVKL